MENKDKIEIPFGAKDSELCECEYTIPEGYEAKIKDGKVIIRKKESEDERIRKHLIFLFEKFVTLGVANECEASEIKVDDILAWLKKQGEPTDIPADAVLDSNKDGLIADTIRCKIEKQGEQKLAEWNEEDDQFLLVCKNALAKYQKSDKWDAGIISHWLENKLKSLTQNLSNVERNGKNWRPTDGQMQALEFVLAYHAFANKERREELKKLFEQLKAL